MQSRASLWLFTVWGRHLGHHQPPLHYFNMLSSKNELHKITMKWEKLTSPFNVRYLACYCSIKHKKETECPQSRVCTDHDIDPSKSLAMKPRPLHRAGSPTVCVEPSTQSEVMCPELEITHAVMTTTDDQLSFITINKLDDRICYQYTRSLNANKKLVWLLKS